MMSCEIILLIRNVDLVLNFQLGIRGERVVKFPHHQRTKSLVSTSVINDMNMYSLFIQNGLAVLFWHCISYYRFLRSFTFHCLKFFYEFVFVSPNIIFPRNIHTLEIKIFINILNSVFQRELLKVLVKKFDKFFWPEFFWGC